QAGTVTKTYQPIRFRSATDRCAGAGERKAGEADRDRGEMPEVGEAAGDRGREDHVSEDGREVADPRAWCEQVAGERGDGEEAVADADVAGEGDARVDGAHVNTDREAGGDDQGRAYVTGREDEQRAPPAEPALDRRDDDGEEHEPLRELTPARRPESAADEDAQRDVRQLVEVGAEREQQPIVAVRAREADDRGRRGQNDQVGGRQRRRAKRRAAKRLSPHERLGDRNHGYIFPEPPKSSFRKTS